MPTVLHAGDAFNVVPGIGELVCDLRADSLDAFDGVLQALPAELGGARLEAKLVRQWPGMDAREAAAPLLAAAAAALGRPVIGAGARRRQRRGHFAATIPFTVDGLGPRGGGAHAPHEYLLATSLKPRAEVALAVADAALRRLARAGSGGAASKPHSREPLHLPNYPLDCSGLLDQPSLCRATAESGGTKATSVALGRIVV